MNWRRVRIFAAVLGALLFMAIAAVMVVLRTAWFREQVRQRIVAEVERASGGRAELGAFQFEAGAMRAEVRDFILHGTEAPGSQPLLRVRRAAVGLKLVSILRRDVDIHSLDVEEPRLRIQVHPDGTTNLPRPKVPRRGPRNAVEQFLALAIGRVDIRDGTVECGIEKLDVELHGEQLRAQMFYQAAPEKYLGEVSMRQARFKSPYLPPSPMEFSSKVELEGNRVTVRNGTLRMAKSTLRVDGSVADWFSPKVDARFSGEVPVAEFVRAASLPVAPVGTATVEGDVHYDRNEGWRVRSNVSARGLAYQESGVRVDGASLHATAQWTPGRLHIPRLQVMALGGRFDGTASLDGDKVLRVDGRLQEVPLARAFAARGLATPPWEGSVSGDVHLDGRLGSNERRLAATLSLDGPSIHGTVKLDYDRQTNRLTLGRTLIETAASRVELQGDPETSLCATVRTSDLNDLLPAMRLAGAPPPEPLPIAIENGEAQFDGTVAGGLRSPRIQGRVALRNVVYQGRKFDHASATIDVMPDSVRAENIAIERGRMRVSGHARIGLRSYRTAPELPLAATLTIANADVAELAPPDYRGPKLNGVASAHLVVQGTANAPVVRGNVELTRGSAGEQTFDNIRATVDYTSPRLIVSKAHATIGNAPVEWSATYTHAPGNWRRGSLRVKLSTAKLPLSSLAQWKAVESTADGHLNAQLEASAEIDESGAHLKEMVALAESLDVTLGTRTLGSVRVRAATANGKLEIHPRAELAGASVSGLVRVGLDAPNAVQGELQFRRLALSTLRTWWSRNSGEPLPIEAFSEGRLTFHGQGFEPLGWKARADVGLLEIKPRTDATGSKLEELGLRNPEPIVVEGTLGELRVVQARLLGHDTNLEIGGKVTLGAKGRFDLRFKGGVDLAILHDFEPDLSAAGKSELDAEVRGPLDDPGLYGRLKLINASLYFSGVPNGIDKANGTVFFDRHRATIESLTAQSGGGTLSVKGFLGFGGADTVYRLQANADQVRVRYPEGFSTTMNAALNLTGTASRSLLAGTVRVSRSSINPRMDFSGLLAQSSQPVVTPVISNQLLRGMQFDVHVETVPNARLETTLTRDIQIEANLRLRGNPAKPVLLGRISATQGEVNFFGTKYNISRGELSFVNPTRLEPVVSLDLETRIRGIDVTVSLAGPPNKLNMTYRSDPPLQLQELMALLTVGRAPSSNPSVAVRQFDTGLDWQQVGAGALLGQALATPITGRLQRFFGVSRIKIDPQLRGVENNPQARLTVEQQISKDITFTYITNLNKGQQQIVGLQWNVNKQWSIQAIREENGMFGVEFLYRKQFK